MKKRNAETISTTVARAWRAPMPRLDPELAAVLAKAWRAARVAGRNCSSVVVKRA
jgi:hypothetical protein